MADIEHIIMTLGGVRKTARACDVAPSTVQHWKTSRRVPRWHRERLLTAYEARLALDEQSASDGAAPSSSKNNPIMRRVGE
ncbi:carph-isopro domain-containing protein [Iodidimonas gelatinilytica]|nr:helix-turn-helix domain-containing protein [Iodidimonas gelatinilytica]